ncbi:unnamed protein product [Albugo candida]|uniref:Uncharacterized protein n=1 Tax=Albugo candida TaxID=65357 RepID=A0A024GMN0_9STRA|nr:unnamed protein product [Albugo candida]|eukprot:CCI47959.1 unnamed protein product [Albugo candida]
MDAAQKLTLPLDALIQHKKSIRSRHKATKPSRKQPKRRTNVKKTVVVPVSSKMRARANLADASLKRQAVVNKRRKGLEIAQGNQKQNKMPKVSAKWSSQLHRSAKNSSEAKLPPKKPLKTHPSDLLDVSNIQRHFKTHPKKFDLPEGTNLRITIEYVNGINTPPFSSHNLYFSLKKVQPVVGTTKK